MPKLFGQDIAGQLAKAMGPGLLPATITRTTRTALSENPTGPGTVTTTTHKARGFVESYKLSMIDGEHIIKGDQRVTLLGATIKPAIEPTPGDVIAIDGKSLVVIALEERDPAAATYVLQTRGS